jgi:thiol-disulfide isomerase/thioredoxin
MKKLLPILAALALVGLAPLPARAAAAKGAEPLVVAHGAAINLADYLVPGKTTVVDFTSKYCGPCQLYNEPLHRLHRERDDIAVVKVDINRPDFPRIDWQSPVARQFKLQSIPHFKIFGPDGKLIAEDKLVIGPDGKLASRDSAARAMVDRWIKP